VVPGEGLLAKTPGKTLKKLKNNVRSGQVGFWKLPSCSLGLNTAGKEPKEK
jgi:hypothetical protein